MNPFDSPGPIDRARREAHRLLKDLRSQDPLRSSAAEARFRQLGSFQQAAPGKARAPHGNTRLKHALAVVAIERGHDSWLSLKHAATSAPPAFHAHCLGGFLFSWFSNWEEAAATRRESGSYLLPFGAQCFVCEAEALRELGLDPQDPDWRAVGFDLVRPADAAAGERLLQKRRAAIRAGIAVPAVPEPSR